ncbi:MAG: VWA domain-containing protein [Chlorobiaceae bacterium]|nr:VWA domain-containing protein [Chlorobiaceae bacterium]
MCFARPDFLIFLWLVIPVIALSVFGARRKLKARRKIGGAASSSILPRIDLLKVFARRGMLCLGTGLLILSISGPELCNGQRPLRRKGVDVVFMLDVSNSMLARDVAPDRLSRAKSELLQVSRSLGEGRKALLLFAGASVVQCPLTSDQDGFETLLDMASPDLIGPQGTDYRRAFETAIRLGNADRSSGSEMVLVLASDGEDHGQDFEDVAGVLKRQGIHLHAIGVGTGEPAAIPMPDGPKRDRQGQLVMTRFRPDVFGAMVRKAGGNFYHSRPEAPVHDFVSSDIAAEAAAARWIMVPAQRRPIHRECILAAILLCIAGTAMTDVVTPGKRGTTV